jgi:hypothetical protein
LHTDYVLIYCSVYIALTETAATNLSMFGGDQISGEKVCVQENPDSIIVDFGYI